jgi:hypothetical protein
MEADYIPGLDDGEGIWTLQHCKVQELTST